MLLSLRPRSPPPRSALALSILGRLTTPSLLQSFSFPSNCCRRRLSSPKRLRSCSMSPAQEGPHSPSPSPAKERVRFINTGPLAVPGLIVMSIEDGHEGVPGLTQLDPIYYFVVVLVNAMPTEIEYASPSLKAKARKLHPIQLMSSDELVKSSAYDASSGALPSLREQLQFLSSIEVEDVNKGHQIPHSTIAEVLLTLLRP